MMGITPQQAKVLDFIRRQQQAGHTPGYREIAREVGIALSNAHRTVRCLIERGRLRQIPGCSRALEVVEERPPITTFSTNELLRELARRGVRP